MISKMIRAAFLDPSVYEEVEEDSNATIQAILIVAMVSIASGLAALGQIGPVGILYGLISGIVLWALWALLTFIIGVTLFNTKETEASWGQLARVTGFAQTPGILFALGIIPFVGLIIVAIAQIWQLVAMVIGVRQALDYTSTLRAVFVVMVGFVVVLVLRLLLLSI